jgi:hypothetical protein
MGFYAIRKKKLRDEWHERGGPYDGCVLATNEAPEARPKITRRFQRRGNWKRMELRVLEEFVS